MAIEIDALEISIQHSAQGTAAEIDKLTKSLERMKEATRGGAGLNKVVKAIENLAKAAPTFNVDKMESSLRQVVVAAGNTSVAMQEYVMWARAARDIGIRFPKSSGLSSSSSGGSAQEAVVQVEKMTEAAREASEAVQEVGRSAQEGMGQVSEKTQSAASATRELAKETRRVAHEAKKSTGPIGNLAKSFLRIAKMRMIRAILRGIITALKEGVTNLYHYSQAVNNTDTAQAASTMDAYASALLKVKNSIAAALMPVIQAALPLIQTITNAIITALNAFNKFISALTGHSTWTYATDATAQFASNLNSATGAAKELKKTIMGFDELNILEGPSNGGGGGGGSGSTDPGSMFSTDAIEPEYLKKIDEMLKPIVDAVDHLKKVWDDFMDTPLGTALRKAVDWLKTNIPIELFAQIANIFNIIGDAIELINTLFDKDMTLGEKFMNIFGLAGDIGQSFGEVISTPQRLVLGFFNQVLGSLFGKEGGLLSDQMVSDLAMATSPLGTVGVFDDLVDILKKIVEYLKKILGIDDSKKADKLNKTAADVADRYGLMGVTSVVGSNRNGNDVRTYEEKSLHTAQSFIKSISEFDFSPRRAFDTIKEGFWDKFWFNQDGTTFWQWLTKGLRSNESKKAGEKVSGVLLNKNSLGKGLTWFENNVTRKMSGDMLDAAEESGKRFESLGSDISRGMNSAWGDTKSIWENSGKWFEDNVTSPTGRSFGELKRTIRTESTGAWNDMSATWSNKGEWFKSNLVAPVKNAFDTLLENIHTTFSDANLEAKVVQPINNKLSQIKSPTVDINIRTPKIDWYLKEVQDYGLRQKLGALNIGTTLPELYVHWYAGGGIVPAGDLFFAGERGPELVGSMGGQTAVANQDQIIDGISRGVYNAMISAMSQTNGGDNTITVQIGDTTLASVVTKALNAQTRRLGYSQLEGI